MNAITLLEEQHRDVEKLFKRCEKLDDEAADEKLELFEQIADMLAIHATIEEKIFYPAMNTKLTHEQLMEAVEEHLSVKRLLADLLELDAEEEQFDAKLSVLTEQVRHHVKEEREELFPKVRAICTNEELIAIGEEMLRMTELLQGKSPRMQVPQQTDEAPALM